MKKLLSFVIVALMIVSSISPVFAVTADDVTVPTEENRFSVWAEDTEFDPEKDQYVDIYVNVSNNTDGFEYLKWFTIYPECLTLYRTTATGIATSSDLTPGIERDKADGIFARSLMLLRGYDVGQGDEFDTPEQIATFEAREKELLEGKKWTSPLFDCERFEYDEELDEEIPVDTFDNGRICRFRFTYDASKNPTGEDLHIELWEDYEGALHSPNPKKAEWADEWAYYDADNYGCTVKIKKPEPPAGDPTFTLNEVTINQGDPTATFNVDVSGNPGIFGTQICVVYDDDMAYENFENGEVFASSALPVSPINTPSMRDQKPQDMFKKIAFAGLEAAFEAAGVSYEGKLMTIAQYENSTFDNVTNNGKLFSLTLDTSALAAGEYDISIVYQPDNTIDNEYNNVPFKVVQGKLTVVGATCDHTNTTTEHQDATCTEDGFTRVTCNDCGTVLTDEVIPALGHDYEATVTPPTCTEAGYTTYTCSRCGDTYTADPVDALGHTPAAAVQENVVPAKCEADGSYDEVVYCTVCGTELSRETKTEPATGHDWEQTIVTGNCGEIGTIHYVCKNDASHTKTEEGALIEHNWVETARTEATCEVDGSVSYKCSRCGDTKTDVLPATGHDYEATVTPPTCTEAGYTTYVCKNDASHTYTEAGEPALGHDYKAVVTAPTCTEAGYTTYTCSRCDDTYTADPVEALGHKAGAPVQENVVPAKCEADGSYDEVVYCERCGAELSRETKTIPATGHDYEAAAVVAPTCTEAGYTTYVCKNDASHTYTADEVPALGHDYVAVVTEPTCTEDGYTTYTCSRCGDTYTDDVVEKLGHDWDEGVETPATCETDGGMLFTCKRCGETKLEDVIPALGHDWDDGVVTKEATAEEEGEITYTCKRDPSHTKTEPIPKLEPVTPDPGKPEPTPTPTPAPKPDPNKGGAKQTGDNITTLVFIAMIAAVSGAAVIVAKKKLFNK